MADIFISYAREDEDRIGPLVQMLEAQGWSVFWDRRIPGGRLRTYVLSAFVLLIVGGVGYWVYTRMTGGPRPVVRVLEQSRTRLVKFSGLSSKLLAGNEFAGRGIRRIEASPAGAYCSDAKAAILSSGSYRSPVSFLTTASPGDLKQCNAVPVTIHFARPVRPAASCGGGLLRDAGDAALATREGGHWRRRAAEGMARKCCLDFPRNKNAALTVWAQTPPLTPKAA